MHHPLIQTVQTVLAVLCLLFSATGSTQEITAQSYQAQTEEYAAIVATGKAFSFTKWKVAVDFGQVYKWWTIKNKDLLRDNSGKVITFESLVDALNFLNSKGWKLVTASANEQYFYAIMKREK